MQRGDLLPSEAIQSIIARELKRGRPPVVIEGYPRRLEEAFTLPTLCGRTVTVIPVFLDIPQDVSIARLTKRVLCGRCGRVSMEEKHSICPKCDGLFITRDDDKSQATIERRFSIFERETVPLVRYYESQEELEVIDSSHDVVTVHRQIIARVSARSS
jgi:adenylate kinase